MKHKCIFGGFINYLLFSHICLASAMTHSNRQFSAHLKGQLSENNQERVKIFLSILPFKKMEAINQKGDRLIKFQPQSLMKHFLRSQYTKKNHFFLSDYHIVISPKNWQMQTGEYSFQIDFLKRFGQYGQVEETIGSLKIDGYVEKSEKNLIFFGQKTHRFVNQWGQPELEVTIGTKNLEQAQSSSRKASSG